MKRLSFYLYSLILILLGSCAKEKDFPTARQYPLIKTSSVTADSKTVTARGQITLQGKKEVTEYGFIYNSTSTKTKATFKKTLPLPAQTGSFRIQFDDNILKDVVYELYAYAVVDGFTVQGEKLIFKGGGTSTPVVTDFEPKQGFDGTLITIKGENFTEVKEYLKVKIGEANAVVVDATPNQITVRSPVVNYLGSFPITITLHDKQVTTKENYTIIGPHITHLSSNTARPGEVITIFGEHLSQPFNKNYREVMIGGKSATIKTWNDKEISVIVPQVSSTLYDQALTVSVNGWNKPAILPYVLTIPSDFNLASVAPTNLGTLYSGMPAFVYGSKAYFFALDHFISYDMSTGSWSSKSAFPGLKRSGTVIAKVGNKAYILGGGESSIRYYNDAWEYDLPTDTWTRKPNLPSGVYGATSFVMNDKIYYFGGINSSSSYTLREYNPETGEIKNKQLFPIGISPGGGSTFIQSNKVYALIKSLLETTLWEYNADQDTWTNLGNGPSKGIAFNVNNQGYAISPDNGAGLSRYNAAENKWEIVALYPGCITNGVFTGFAHNNRLYLASFSCSMNVYYHEVQ